MEREPKLWIILGRPVRLPNALIAVHTLGDRFPGGFHLLRDESQWWDRAQWQPYARHFADVHAFPRVKTCRGKHVGELLPDASLIIPERRCQHFPPSALSLLLRAQTGIRIENFQSQHHRRVRADGLRHIPDSSEPPKLQIVSDTRTKPPATRHPEFGHKPPVAQSDVGHQAGRPEELCVCRSTRLRQIADNVLRRPTAAGHDHRPRANPE